MQLVKKELKKELMDYLVSELENCVAQQFTGKLDISTSKGDYSLYFGLGRLVWATGGWHSRRRWQRNLTQFCPDLDVAQLRMHRTEEMDNWEYSSLVNSLHRGYLNKENLLMVATGAIREVLFDLLQIIAAKEAIASSHSKNSQDITRDISGENRKNIYKEHLQLKAHWGSRPAGNQTLPRALTIDLAEIFAEVRKEWQCWERVIGTEAIKCSPNQVPVLRKPANLKQKISAKSYRNLSVLASGNYTIRDISSLLCRPAWQVMNLLLPHVRTSDIGLVDVADLDNIAAVPGFKFSA
jgi:chemotaxis family two-component system response regulator PixG